MTWGREKEEVVVEFRKVRRREIVVGSLIQDLMVLLCPSKRTRWPDWTGNSSLFFTQCSLSSTCISSRNRRIERYLEKEKLLGSV